MVYTSRDAYLANQGDVFAGVPFNSFTMDGMITSHDCVCDKYLSPKKPLSQEAAAKFVISVAPVHPIDQLTGERQAAVRQNKMPRYFLLPDEDSQGELVVDLWLDQPVVFADLLGQCERRASLSDEWRGRLWQQFLRLRLGEDYLTFLKELVDAS